MFVDIFGIHIFLVWFFKIPLKRYMSLKVFCKLPAAELMIFQKTPNGASSSMDDYKSPLVNFTVHAVQEQPRECGKNHLLLGFDVPKHSSEFCWATS